MKLLVAMLILGGITILVTYCVGASGGGSPYVPAIQEQQKSGLANCHGENDNLWHCTDSTYPVTTCADKTRILEHDEQTPPKYWCRKVQP